MVGRCQNFVESQDGKFSIVAIGEGGQCITITVREEAWGEGLEAQLQMAG